MKKKFRTSEPCAEHFSSKKISWDNDLLKDICKVSGNHPDGLKRIIKDILEKLEFYPQNDAYYNRLRFLLKNFKEVVLW